MANTDAPSGLVPVRHRNGAAYNGATNPYFIPSSYATALFVGDPVIKTGTANTAKVDVPGAGSFGIGTMAEINKATAGDTNRITGVIVGFSALPTGLESVHNPASTERVALVCDDPDVIFEIQADNIDAGLGAVSIGLNANVIFTHSGSTTTGKSGGEMNALAGGDPPAADASNQLVIMRAVNREDNDITLAHAKFEVMINQHTENQGTVGTLGI